MIDEMEGALGLASPPALLPSIYIFQKKIDFSTKNKVV